MSRNISGWSILILNSSLPINRLHSTLASWSNSSVYFEVPKRLKGSVAKICRCWNGAAYVQIWWHSTTSVKRSHKGHSFGCIATVYSLDTVFASCNLDLEFIHCWIVVLLNWFKFCSIFNLSNSRACLLCSLFLESFYQFTTLAFQFFVCIFQIIICCMELRLILDCVLPNINLCEKDEK
jgi:hypothetical protein